MLGVEQRVAQVQVAATVAINQLNAQQHEPTEQRTRFDEMQTTMLSLQNQFTIVRHQSPVITPQKHLEIHLASQYKAMRATLEVALRASVGWQVVAGLPSRKTEKARWRGIGTLQEQLDLQKEGPTSSAEHIC